MSQTSFLITSFCHFSGAKFKPLNLGLCVYCFTTALTPMTNLKVAFMQARTPQYMLIVTTGNYNLIRNIFSTLIAS
jgi:hypothetical protein